MQLPHNLSCCCWNTYNTWRWGCWNTYIPWRWGCRVLNELRHRILPVDLLHHRPQEAAFLLSLLHPIPWKRPSVKEILCSEVLVLLHRKLCGKALPGVVRRRQGQRQTSDGGRAKRALLADVLRFMRRCGRNILLTGAVEHFMETNCKSQLYRQAQQLHGHSLLGIAAA